jgi:AmiR/NasT family two-component response regulator
VDLFARLQALQDEAAALRATLEERKLIERAKGALVKRLELDEEEAYRKLRGYASDRNLRLAIVARDVIAAEDVFRSLE